LFKNSAREAGDRIKSGAQAPGELFKNSAREAGDSIKPGAQAPGELL
jgi:hypothetical protein